MFKIYLHNQRDDSNDGSSDAENCQAQGANFLTRKDRSIFQFKITDCRQNEG